MLAIYKREFKACFQTFIGFLFIAVSLFFLGLYFYVYNLYVGYPYYTYVIDSVCFVFLISIPILCMRILAEERHNKTDQLVLTAPVSVGDVVVGKFLALLSVFAIPTLISCTYPLIMSRYGSISMSENYLGILAYFLFGMAAIAVCVFLSSLTESQVIAAVLGFIVLFLGYMMSSICSIISSTGNIITVILSCFDLYTPFGTLLNGTLDLTSVVYFFSLTALVLFLTVQSIQKRRYSVSVKTLSLSAYSTSMTVVMIAIVAAINIVLGTMPVSWTQIDVTSSKLYSLTAQTIDYVKTIDEDVTIYVIVNEDSADTIVKQMLQRYDELSDHITVTYIDPSVNPRFHTQYTSSSISTDSIIVVSDKRSMVIDYSDIYEYEYSIDYTTYSYTTTTTGYDGEGQVTSAINYVLSEDLPKMYIIEGHGESTLSDTFAEALTKENIDTETINLMDYDEIPEDAACLLINAPTGDFSEDDAEKVIAYLEQGGKVIMITYYGNDDTTNLDTIYDYMGLSVAEGLIIEQSTSNYYRSPFYLLPTISSSTYTSGVYGSYYVFIPYGQGILTDSTREDITYDEFLTTSSSAFSKVSIETMEDYSMTDGDIEGPFALGVEAVKTITDDDGNEVEATMVAYGCYQMFTDSASEMVSGANLQIFSNTASAFVDHEVSVSIPVKSVEVSYLTVNELEAMLLGAMTTVILPLCLLVAGFVIWFRRRKK